MIVREQRRGRRIAMSSAELDAFLAGERTCRVATVSPAGPHNTPLWFVWDGTTLWLTSIVKSQRWTDLARDPRVAVLVDAGEAYDELRGADHYLNPAGPAGARLADPRQRVADELIVPWLRERWRT